MSCSLRAETVRFWSPVPLPTSQRVEIWISRSVADELQPSCFRLEQDVGQDRQRVSPFDDAGYRLQRFQQRIAFDLEKFHDVLL